jgi:hypothetical protein
MIKHAFNKANKPLRLDELTPGSLRILCNVDERNSPKYASNRGNRTLFDELSRYTTDYADKIMNNE